MTNAFASIPRRLKREFDRLLLHRWLEIQENQWTSRNHCQQSNLCQNRLLLRLKNSPPLTFGFKTLLGKLARWRALPSRPRCSAVTQPVLQSRSHWRRLVSAFAVAKMKRSGLRLGVGTVCFAGTADDVSFTRNCISVACMGSPKCDSCLQP